MLLIIANTKSANLLSNILDFSLFFNGLLFNLNFLVYWVSGLD